MNKTLANLLIFTAGLAVGAGSTCFFWKKKYEARAQEEIDSVKAIYTYKKQEPIPDPDPPKDENGEAVVVSENMYKASIYEPVDYGNFYTEKAPEDTETSPLIFNKVEEHMAEKESPTERVKPYLITEDEYTDTEPSFDKVSCTFYVPDHVLVDDLSREVMELEVVGDENIEFLIKSNEDIVYVRNENISCDIEISKSVTSIDESGAQVWYG